MTKCEKSRHGAGCDAEGDCPLRLFSGAYLFGSVLRRGAHPEDIDILLVYPAYSDGVLQETARLEGLLAERLPLPPHITVLSEAELESTDFLRRAGKYVRIG